MTRPHSVYPFISRWVSGMFPSLANVNSAAVNKCLFEPPLDIEKEMEVVMAGSGESFMPGPFRAYQQAEEMAIESGILRVGNTGSHNCPESSKLNWFWFLYSLTLARSLEVLYPL